MLPSGRNNNCQKSADNKPATPVFVQRRPNGLNEIVVTREFLKWVTNYLTRVVTNHNEVRSRGEKTRTKLRVFDTLCYSLISPKFKSCRTHHRYQLYSEG